MKKSGIVLLCVGVLLTLVLLVCRSQLTSSKSSIAYATTMELSGTPGASFSGEYLQGGKRVAFSGVLPWSVTESNLSRLEVRKSKAQDTLVLNARGGGSMVSAQATPGTLGLRLKMEGGWSVETLQ